VRTTLAALIVLAAPAIAQARTSQDYPYPFEKAWSASVRLVRVDLRFPIGDRDEQLGFFLFDYQDGPRSYPGSVELLRQRVEGRDGVRVVVQISAMPSYVERMILDRLGHKLVDDFGEPAPRPPPAQPPPSDRSPPGRGGQSGRQPGQSVPRQPSPPRQSGGDPRR